MHLKSILYSNVKDDEFMHMKNILGNNEMTVFVKASEIKTAFVHKWPFSLCCFVSACNIWIVVGVSKKVWQRQWNKKVMEK